MHKCFRLRFLKYRKAWKKARWQKRYKRIERRIIKKVRARIELAAKQKQASVTAARTQISGSASSAV